ncbi:unnamed protein product [Urochloa humidicola]
MKMMILLEAYLMARTTHTHLLLEPTPMGDAYGPPSFDLNMDAQESVDEVDGFSAPTTASNFGLNIHLEQEEAGEDANVYAEDFHVIFAEEELQGSSDHGDQAGAFNAAHGAATFDLNYDFEQEVLDGSSDEEHVPQGSQRQHARKVIKRKNLSDKERQ